MAKEEKRYTVQPIGTGAIQNPYATTSISGNGSSTNKLNPGAFKDYNVGINQSGLVQATPNYNVPIPDNNNQTTPDTGTGYEEVTSPEDFLSGMFGSWEEWQNATNNYIDDLKKQANGDADFMISQLTADHQLALGTNDIKRAEFLESVADSLESEIGRIPYDYQVGVSRLEEDFGRTKELNERNKKMALDRLAEDEQVWKEEFGDESLLARENQQEDLLKRGILSGTREEAQGLATKDIGNLETGLSRTLQAYDRALGRSRSDIETASSDEMFDATRNLTRGKEDYKTIARRGGIDAQNTYKFGTEGVKRQLEARLKELERLRAKELGVGQQEAVNSVKKYYM